MKTLGSLAIVLCMTCVPVTALAQQNAETVPVEIEKVREQPVQRSLPLSGRIFSRHDAALSFTLSGEVAWVLEAGNTVKKGQVVGQLDQQPILLRKEELLHQKQRERVNADYLDKELQRLKQLKEDNNASERLVDESESQRDISRLVVRSLQARIDQLDDELRRSQLVAPYAGVIAQRFKRGGEYSRTGDVILRLVDVETLELRFQVPVVYLNRISMSKTVEFTAQGGALLGDTPLRYEAIIRTIIPAADASSQTFEVRADLASTASDSMVAGQLVNVSVQIPTTQAALQVPRDAVVLRDAGGHVFLITDDNKAKKIKVEVGEGSQDWVSVTGNLRAGDTVAIRGVERLQDGQQVEAKGK
ncbi:MAG: efflux RND transporter periplasmic adaptor subunit [Halioglobus sp.]